jgi:hypothetical protein
VLKFVLHFASNLQFAKHFSTLRSSDHKCNPWFALRLTDRRALVVIEKRLRGRAASSRRTTLLALGSLFLGFGDSSLGDDTSSGAMRARGRP